MKLPQKTLERKLFRIGYKYIIAVDEVGVGPLAGPVTVCAVLVTSRFFSRQNKKLYGVRDSKLLSAKQREIFAEELKKDKNIKFALAYSHVRMIDKINIYRATRRAMRRAVNRLNYEVGSMNYGMKSKNPNSKFII